MTKNNVRKDPTISQAVKLDMIDFLAWYKNIAQIHTDKELKRRFPKLRSEVLSIFKRNQLILKTNLELQSYDFKTISDDTVVYSKKDTKTLCLLRHIRNSIAHWNIDYYREKKYFVIQDYNSSICHTAYGVITLETFRRLLQLSKIK